MEQVLAAAWVSRVGWGGKEALGLGIRRRAHGLGQLENCGERAQTS